MPGISSQEWSGYRYFGWNKISDCSIDVLGTLVRLSESDRPAGIQSEVLRAVSNMVVLLDEKFLVHSAVHKAVLRLLRNCVGDDLQEQLDGRSKLMGAARNVARAQPSEHEEDCNVINFLSEISLISHFWLFSGPFTLHFMQSNSDIS